MIDELNGDFLQWLRGFYYVAKTGSLRKAADIMHRNPSTISYQLRMLEGELGTVLFDRYKKSLRITPEGRNLLTWTISTFETLQSMRSSIGNLRGELQGHVSMAATLPMVTMSACAISAFTRKHPRISLVIERGLGVAVRKKVEESEVDFGILPVIRQQDNDKFEPLLTASPILVMRRNNPWRVPAVPQIEDLKRLPYVSFVSGTLQDELLDSADANLMDLKEYIQKNSVIQINNYHLIMRFVWNMLGVAIMDELCFQASNFGADWDDMLTISLNHLLPNRVYGILTRRRKHISPQAYAFMDALRGYFSSIEGVNDPAAWERIRHRDGKNSEC